MQISIASILSASEIADVRMQLGSVPFVDGRKTAGWSASLVKDNEQAAAEPIVDELRQLIIERIGANATFHSAARPKAFAEVMFSRYGTGRSYGRHVDNALMGGLRTDVSFTLFLSDSDSYDGGELIIERASGNEAIKLDAGCLVVYPSTELHQVAPVTRGERLVAVGWVRSFVRDALQRELLFDLDQARRGHFDAHGKTPEFDLLTKSYTNLQRMWLED